MKLWIKLSGISLICALIALSGCLYAFCVWQTGETIAAAETSARDTLKLFVTNVESVDRAYATGDLDALTGRSVAQYYFATYAHLLSGGAYFSLAQAGEYLYNTCPYDPISRLTLNDNAIEMWTTLNISGEKLFIARPLDVLGQTYTAYMCADVSGAYARARALTRVSQLMLLAAALMILACVPPLVRRALKPMRRLSDTARNIARGDYALRAEARAGDEVGALAESFNVMAEAVEDKISALTEESERRRLLLGALAHEIKTPMTSVIGYAGSLIKMPLSETQKSHSAISILEAGKRMERMTVKLMQLLSLDGEALEMKRFPLNELARELNELYGARVRITCETDALNGERDLIYSLITNLINNALSATDDNDVILVRVTPDSISVQDHGRGIPAEHIARLTDPFYRVDKARSRKHGGAGLGLSLCKEIARAHGGDLYIQSAPGAGTTVTATLNRESI